MISTSRSNGKSTLCIDVGVGGWVYTSVLPSSDRTDMAVDGAAASLDAGVIVTSDEIGPQDAFMSSLNSGGRRDCVCVFCVPGSNLLRPTDWDVCAYTCL